MNSNEDRQPVDVPPEWDAAQDLEFCENILTLEQGEALFPAAVEYAHAGYEELDETLDRALHFFGVPQSALDRTSPPEKVRALGVYVAERAPAKAYVRRLTVDLEYCRFALQEHARVLPAYGHDCREQGWLKPVVDLGDLLITAAMGFEASMRAEHRNYPQQDL